MAYSQKSQQKCLELRGLDLESPLSWPVKMWRRTRLRQDMANIIVADDGHGMKIHIPSARPEHFACCEYICHGIRGSSKQFDA